MEWTHALKRAGAQFSIPSGKKIIFPEKAFVNRQHTIVNPTAFFFKDLSKSRTKKWRLDKTLMTGIQENKQICLKMKNPEPVKEDR